MWIPRLSIAIRHRSGAEWLRHDADRKEAARAAQQASWTFLQSLVACG